MDACDIPHQLLVKFHVLSKKSHDLHSYGPTNSHFFWGLFHDIFHHLVIIVGYIWIYNFYNLSYSSYNMLSHLIITVSWAIAAAYILFGTILRLKPDWRFYPNSMEVISMVVPIPL